MVYNVSELNLEKDGAQRSSFDPSEYKIPLSERYLHPTACRDLAKNGMQGNFTYLIVWVPACWSSGLFRDLPALSIVVTLLLIAFGTVRTYLAVRFDKLFFPDPERWYRATRLTILGLAVSFSVGGSFAIYLTELSWATFLFSTTTGTFAAAARSTLQTHVYLYRSFTLTSIIPVATALILLQDSTSITMGILFLILILYLRVFGTQGYNLYWETVENAALLADRAKQMEVARRRAEAMGQAKTEFLANMSHELRTPLNAILGFSQLMTRSKTLSEVDRDHLGAINRSGEHLLDLINQILDMSKIEAGRLSVESSVFDLRQMLTDLREMFSLRAAKRGLELRLEVENTLPHFVFTDGLKVRQILINLLGNAIKFTERGHVTLRARLKSDTKGGEPKVGETVVILFEVEDTGPGIADEEIGDLFSTFTQTTSGKAAREGTGLGLALSERLVLLLGGQIDVGTKVGKGSTFFIEIAMQVAKGTASETNRKRSRVVGVASRKKRYKLLVVDDVATNRHVLTQLLRDFDFEVTEAENGKEAIQVWEREQPDLIWMDMRMPVMDGYEATRQIRKLAEAQQIRVRIVAITASNLMAKREGVYAAGCDDFVAKPFKEIEIFEALERNLDVVFAREAEAPADESADLGEPVYGQEGFVTELRSLPQERLKALFQASEAADMDAVLSWMETTEIDLSEEFMSYLADLLEGYRIDLLPALIEQAETE